MKRTQSDIRISALLPKSLTGRIVKLFAPLLDRLLGINKLREIYLKEKLSNLEKQKFSTKLLQVLAVRITGEQGILDKVPKQGGCIIVCNHPYGMIEGVIIARLISSKRTDTKIMANLGLKVFSELKDYFIFANPLRPKSSINISAIKQCFDHVKNEGILVIFPAGRVSFHQTNAYESKMKSHTKTHTPNLSRVGALRITDGQWNRLAVQIATRHKVPILPVFISGTNSKFFHFFGRVYFRFRLLMLVREMFKLRDKEIDLMANKPLESDILSQCGGIEKMNDFVRVQCYLNDMDYFTPWPEDKLPDELQDIALPCDAAIMKKELTLLPKKQQLLTFKNYTVYYGYQDQLPQCVSEIARLREVTFRTLNEGSGESIDTDEFDATYMHLFIFDNKNEEIIGAYRIGLTDVLLKTGDKDALYLSQMFNFESSFVNHQQPCMEMGRSFIIKAHQNSFHGLLLLWKGIGAFVCQNPQYRTLYGTVSLSKVYDPRSVALIHEVMISQTAGVSAISAFKGQIHPELSDYIAKHEVGINDLSLLIKSLEKDGKDIPILLKQYHKLGANFHCLAIDENFNQTPGLLLSVNLPKAPDKLLKLYLGKAKASYLNYSQ